MTPIFFTYGDDDEIEMIELQAQAGPKSASQELNPGLEAALMDVRASPMVFVCVDSECEYTLYSGANMTPPDSTICARHAELISREGFLCSSTPPCSTADRCEGRVRAIQPLNGSDGQRLITEFPTIREKILWGFREWI